MWNTSMIGLKSVIIMWFNIFLQKSSQILSTQEMSELSTFAPLYSPGLLTVSQVTFKSNKCHCFHHVLLLFKCMQYWLQHPFKTYLAPPEKVLFLMFTYISFIMYNFKKNLTLGPWNLFWVILFTSVDAPKH